MGMNAALLLQALARGTREIAQGIAANQAAKQEPVRKKSSSSSAGCTPCAAKRDIAKHQKIAQKHWQGIR